MAKVKIPNLTLTVPNIRFSSKRYFGLDIAESSIKLVEMKKAREGFRIKNARLIELNIDPIFDDSEKREGIVQEKLKQLFAEEGVSTGIVALSISGQSVFIRPLKVPKIAKSKIEQIIHYEAQLQVPFPINEVIWNYELFELYDSPEAEVTLVAVKKDIVEEKLKFLSGSGLEIDHVEVDSFALFNVLDLVDDLKNRIILDIGAKITDIIIAEDHKLWTRSILIGGNDLTKAVASTLKISFREAEELKRREGIVALTEQDRLSSSQAAAISDAISPILVELLTNVSKSIGYYKSQFDKTRLFREILITGGGSKLKNIAEFIRENIDIPTRPFDLFEEIKDDMDFKHTEEMVGRMDVSIGLGLRTVTTLTTKTNLLPKELLYTKEFEKRKWYIFGSMAILMFIFVLLTSFATWNYNRKTATLSKAQNLITRYNSLYGQISQIQSRIDGLRVRMDFISNIVAERKKAILALSEIIKLMPANAWFTEIQQDQNVFTIKGRVKGTFEDIGLFWKKLNSSQCFHNVVVESADVLSPQADDIRSFIIRIERRTLDEKDSGEVSNT